VQRISAYLEIADHDTNIRGGASIPLFRRDQDYALPCRLELGAPLFRSQ
jgi:hypothetical protein